MVRQSDNAFAADEIKESLIHVGVSRGDVVYVHSALHKLGPPRQMESRDAFLNMFLDAFRSVMGSEGTLVVPTFTTQVMRYGIDYVHEETPSVMGIFSEHVRRQPEAVRRFHPTTSFAAMGPHAKHICEDVSLRDAGMDSPYQRMIDLDAKIISLGAGRIFTVSLAHHLEGIYGPPHIYNKLLTCRVFKNGREVKLPFVLGARHLHLNVRYDLKRFADAVAKDSGLAEASLGRGHVYKSEMRDVFRIGAELIRKDWFAFLATPPNFVSGVLPNDGFTSDTEGINTLPVNLIGYYL